jgi:hypothetical protein
MPIHSRNKGAAGERELANTLKELFGWRARRTAQFSGNAGDSDVVIEELPELFVEVKRVQSLSIHPVMQKAKEQCKEKLPIICHRRNQSEWLCTVRLIDLAQVASMICRAGSTDSLPGDTKSCSEEGT